MESNNAPNDDADLDSREPTEEQLRDPASKLDNDEMEEPDNRDPIPGYMHGSNFFAKSLHHGYKNVVPSQPQIVENVETQHTEPLATDMNEQVTGEAQESIADATKTEQATNEGAQESTTGAAMTDMRSLSPKLMPLKFKHNKHKDVVCKNCHGKVDPVTQETWDGAGHQIWHCTRNLDDNGYLDICPPCNSVEHNSMNCPNWPTAISIQEWKRWYFLSVKARAGKPPIKTQCALWDYFDGKSQWRANYKPQTPSFALARYQRHGAQSSSTTVADPFWDQEPTDAALWANFLPTMDGASIAKLPSFPEVTGAHKLIDAEMTGGESSVTQPPAAQPQNRGRGRGRDGDAGAGVSKESKGAESGNHGRQNNQPARGASNEAHNVLPTPTAPSLSGAPLVRSGGRYAQGNRAYFPGSTQPQSSHMNDILGGSLDVEARHKRDAATLHQMQIGQLRMEIEARNAEEAAAANRAMRNMASSQMTGGTTFNQQMQRAPRGNGRGNGRGKGRGGPRGGFAPPPQSTGKRTGRDEEVPEHQPEAKRGRGDGRGRGHRGGGNAA